MIDIIALRESYEQCELTEIWWINSNDNPANALTKAGSNKVLQGLIDTNELTVRIKGWVEQRDCTGERGCTSEGLWWTKLEKRTPICTQFYSVYSLLANSSILFIHLSKIHLFHLSILATVHYEMTHPVPYDLQVWIGAIGVYFGSILLGYWRLLSTKEKELSVGNTGHHLIKWPALLISQPQLISQSFQIPWLLLISWPFQVLWL